jgi:GTP1/Obg family GTP-binding protein
LEVAERQRIEEEKRRLKVFQDSRDRLEAVIHTWAKVNSIRAFFDDIERSAQNLSDEDRKLVMARLAQAKELVGDLDALKHFDGWEPPVL